MQPHNKTYFINFNLESRLQISKDTHFIGFFVNLFGTTEICYKKKLKINIKNKQT